MKRVIANVATSVLRGLGRAIAWVRARLRGPWTYSGIACLVLVILNYLSMGMLGMLLYYPVEPIYGYFLGDVLDLLGEDTWPAAIAGGTFWPFCFVGAGTINRRLLARGVGLAGRSLAYIAVLWLGAALLWGLMVVSMSGRHG